jgi:cysteine synthase
VTIVPSCAISNKNHYVNLARQMAVDSGGFFVDQFENLSNLQAHIETTGPEICAQLAEASSEDSLDAFVMVARA